MATLSEKDLEKLVNKKVKQFSSFLDMEPPVNNGEDLVDLWLNIYDDDVRNIIVNTETGPSIDVENPVFPYEKLQALIRDGGNWKWPRMWQRFDEIERRGLTYREGEILNFEAPNKNPGVTQQRVLIVGGGPIGLRLSIELVMAGHLVTVFEKRRDVKDENGQLKQLGFTNRINRPHMWAFVRNDLAKLNGKEFMSRNVCYPVFTEPETSSIGIDELQCLLLKNALLLGVDFRLGVSYDDGKVHIDPQTCMPTWQIECTYDDKSAEHFGMQPGKNKQEFDCIVGCDGPRSTVRATQGKHFGDIEKRKFMDCVGIVVNVRKVSKKKLKELGFKTGIEPNDMNCAKMFFKDFFKKIKKECGADVENLIYYKASHHNYVIITPKRADLIKNGLSGKLYTFHTSRDQAVDPAKLEEKEKLRNYCAGILKAAGIPHDVNLENGGFVDAPNDCMAFDFAECWNTKKSMAYNLPPNDYDVTMDGPWAGRAIVPFVALCGDSLMEPFWPLGLGLKRGWQAIMDTCYAIDNLYNTACFAKKLNKNPEEITWDEHFMALREQTDANFEMCNRLKVAPELGKGEYDPKGPVFNQLKKAFKDTEVPPLEIEVDPWTRYEALVKEDGDSWKSMPEGWLHPKVEKFIKMKEYYIEVSRGGKSGEIDYVGKELIMVNGKTLAGKRASIVKKFGGGNADAKSGPSKPQPRNAKQIAPTAGGIGALVVSKEAKQKMQESQDENGQAAKRASVQEIAQELQHLQNLIGDARQSLKMYEQAETELKSQLVDAAQ